MIQNKEQVIFKRGEVYFVDLPKDNMNNIQNGYRPVVIASNNASNIFSSIIHVVPLTSVVKRLDLPVHKVVDATFLYKTSMAECEQVRLVDKNKLTNCINWDLGRIGCLSYQDMNKISEGLAAQMGFTFMLKPRDLEEQLIYV